MVGVGSGSRADEAALVGQYDDLSAVAEVEEELRARIEEAHRLGVPGVPCLVVDGEVFWGDDRLADAAAVAARR